MDSKRYVRERNKMFCNLADHCHDKALEQSSPHFTARWMILADAFLWSTTPEAEMSLLESLTAAPLKEGE